MIGCGIDAGSRAMKIVLMDAASRSIVATAYADQRPDQDRLAEELLEEALKSGGAKDRDIGRTVGTGYGRQLLSRADTSLTEITCLARGVRNQVPDVQAILDIGGQDSKVIFLDVKGVRDFMMNDRCAAGTGQFLEMTADRLGLSLSELGRSALRSRQPAAINSTCAVFAETEIVSLLASGITPDDLAAGVLRSVAQRTASLAVRRISAPAVFSGGVARIPGMGEILSLALGQDLIIAPEPHFTAARGAAHIACDGLDEP